MEVRCILVWPKGRVDLSFQRNAVSPGKVKTQCLRALNDAGWLFKYTDLRHRIEGAPFSSERFLHCAAYRDVPFARCGMRVRFQDGDEGVIVGHNSSANFNVLFISGKHQGLTLNCHPNWQIAYLDEKGDVIRSYFTNQTNA